MDIHWLWQGVLSNAAYYVVVAVIGVIAGILKNREVKWLSPVLYGLFTFTLGALLIVSVSIQLKMSEEKAFMVTSQNVQEKVRNWMDNFQLKVQSMSDESFIFGYLITMPNNNKISVTRVKTREHYITISGLIILSPKEKDILAKLSLKKQNEFISQLQIEAARRVGISRINLKDNSIYIEQFIPITPALTENTFIEAINYMDSTLVILERNMLVAMGNM